MRQYAGFTSAEESNNRYRYLIDQGVMGLSVAFDLPTQTGYDSDHSMADGEVGRVGVPICSLSDMDILTNGIPLIESLDHLDQLQRPRVYVFAQPLPAAETDAIPLRMLAFEG